MAHNPNLSPEEAHKANVRHIWKVTAILAGITIVEFILAFQMEPGMLRNSIFIVMTIVKAFYIVSEFMHLGSEVKTLIYVIILPLVFVVWLIIALLAEGSFIIGYK
jgi:cytochrome c oxidase subunit IV